MSRTHAVRRLTTALAVVAALFLALPAGAASRQARAAQAPEIFSSDLIETFLAWLGIAGPAPSNNTNRSLGLSKAVATTPSLAGGGPGSYNSSSTEASQGMDPNGLH